MAKRKTRYLDLADLKGEIVISVEEASRLLDISRTSCYAGCHRGEIPCVKVGESIRVCARPLYLMLTGGLDLPHFESEVDDGGGPM